jgi:hypothetical protein
MTVRRFPPPWSVDEADAAASSSADPNGHKLERLSRSLEALRMSEILRDNGSRKNASRIQKIADEAEEVTQI